MRRSASEIIRDLELRIARLERQASGRGQEDLDWDAYTHTQSVEFTDIILDKNDRAIAKQKIRFNEQGKGYDMDSAIEEALVSIAEDLIEKKLTYEDDNKRDTIYFYYVDEIPSQIDDFKDKDLEKWEEEDGGTTAVLKLKGISKDHFQYFLNYWLDNEYGE